MDNSYQLIKIDPDWGQLRVEIEFIGLVNADYELVLWEANANIRVMDNKGTNHNSVPDKYDLPAPNSKNNGRALQCKTFITFLYDDTNAENEAIMKLYQANSTEPVCVVSEVYSKGTTNHAEGELIIDF